MLPKRVQVFEDSLYITLYDQTIYRINKFGHNKGEVLVESFQRASDLFVLHPLRQDPRSTNQKSKYFLLFQSIEILFFKHFQFQIHARKILARINMYACFHHPIIWVEPADVRIDYQGWQITTMINYCVNRHWVMSIRRVHCDAIRVFVNMSMVNRNVNVQMILTAIFVSIIVALATVKIGACATLMHPKLKYTVIVRSHHWNVVVH